MKRKNSFDFIRLVAASLVVIDHAYVLTGNGHLEFGGIAPGTLGVWVFFILSGYLIAISWDQYPRFNVFFAKRALRIFPGLAVNLLLSVIVVGIFFSDYPFKQFIASPQSVEYLNNIFLYDRVTTMPGVFTHNPLPNSVNASLWTLAYEFTMYIAVALIGAFGIYKRARPLVFWLVLFVLETIIVTVGVSHFDYRMFYLEFDRLIMLALMFFSGIMAYKYAKRITLSYRAGWAALAIFIIASFLLPTFTTLFAATLLAYALFALGRSPRFSIPEYIGDLSYGIYIYSFPIQQSIYAITGTHSMLKMTVASYGLSLVAAWLSWHLIEKRALLLKSKIKLHHYPLKQTDTAW